MAEIDSGDIVKHLPTGEVWTVACVENNRLSWSGWPEGTAALNECELIQKASKEERLNTLRIWAETCGHDHRIRYARRVLGVESSPCP